MKGSKAPFSVDGCDRKNDGLRVRAWYHTRGAPQNTWYHATNFDPNGAATGCDHQLVYTKEIDGIQICIDQPVGCSARVWKYL